VLLEICVDSPEGLLAAMKGGADRVEICSALALGGLTPTTTMMAGAAIDDFPAVAMIRPRPGDFVWTTEEVAHMEAEIDEAFEMGCTGVVLGANRADGRLDLKVLKQLLRRVPDGAEAVLHRCIDLTPDGPEAVEQAVSLGFDRILTSGGAPRAVDGIGRLRAMLDRAAGRITIMPGGGITADNLNGLLALLPVDEVHASGSVALPQDPRAVALGFTGPERRDTSLATVRALRAVLDARG
jgi:copper homeostasis protein